MRQHVIAWLLMFMLGGSWLSAAAQNPGGALPPTVRYTLRFESRHGETFNVFVDGELQNRMPQSRVMVNDVSSQTHEVVVVQKRPVEKAAVIAIRPGEPSVVVYVDYDSRLEKVSLYTASHNRPPQPVAGPVGPATPAPPDAFDGQSLPPYAEDTALQQPVPDVDDDQLNSLAAQMRAQTFDSDRLALGKSIIASARFTVDQIAYLAQVLDYSQSQVEFLKYAYAYCLDPHNYYKVVDVLTYRSDKQKVLDFIATQR